jgi:hypothetical protein
MEDAGSKSTLAASVSASRGSGSGSAGLFKTLGFSFRTLFFFSGLILLFCSVIALGSGLGRTCFKGGAGFSSGSFTAAKGVVLIIGSGSGWRTLRDVTSLSEIDGGVFLISSRF